MSLKGKTILISGGTGSFGYHFLHRALEQNPKEIRIFSRDEKKQYDMFLRHAGQKNMKFVIGDIKDYSRVKEALAGVDIVFQAAALKQVPNCELHPYEAVKTNVIGAENVFRAAVEQGVKQVVALSTDKAVTPVNVMGMTKALQERIAISYNFSPNNKNTKISCVRYGNVMFSRGSAIPLFRDQIKRGNPITITSPDMTRFLLTLDDAIDLVMYAIENMKGGETFVKKAAAANMVDLAKAVYKMDKGTTKGFEYKVIGIRPGEKIHETLVSEEEMSRAEERKDFFIIQRPQHKYGLKGPFREYTSEDALVNFDAIGKLLDKAYKKECEKILKQEPELR